MSEKVPNGTYLLPDEELDDVEDVDGEDGRNWLQKLEATEPLVVRGFVGSVIVLAIAFGAPIDPGQQKAILGFVGAAMVMLASLSGRAVVWPEDHVDEIAGEAYVAGAADAEQAILEAQSDGGPI